MASSSIARPRYMDYSGLGQADVNPTAGMGGADSGGGGYDPGNLGSPGGDHKDPAIAPAPLSYVGQPLDGQNPSGFLNQGGNGGGYTNFSSYLMANSQGAGFNGTGAGGQLDSAINGAYGNTPDTQHGLGPGTGILGQGGGGHAAGGGGTGGGTGPQGGPQPGMAQPQGGGFSSSLRKGGW